MKYCLVILIVYIHHIHLSAQNKQDYYWPFGKDQVLEQSGTQASEFDFNKQPFEPSFRDAGLEFDQNNASICDKDGNLLFYTNGCAVANRLHEVMPHGDSLNYGNFFQTLWLDDCGNGYPGRQDILILPDPEVGQGYYIIHKPNYRDTISRDIIIKDLMYTYVDMSLDGGLGDVTIKNKSFYEGDLHWSYLTAINHDNGDDWWIINPAIKENGYLTYLLSDEGISLNQVQEVGPELDFLYTGSSGDAKFSPDGTKYSLFNHYDGLILFDFDRASGELSNVKQIPFMMPEQVTFGTCEWSPNSRYLYIAIQDSLWQVDTYEDNLEDGRVFIEAYNGIGDPLNNSFWFSSLGPDCRIYIRPGSGTRSFHVIHKPDEKGTACDFEQQGIRLPRISATGSFPNFPRFRVDEEEKCDPSIVSIAGEAVWWRRDLEVFPSPASEYVTVELPEAKRGELFLVNMEGQIMYHRQEVSAVYKVDVSELPAGIYTVDFIPSNNKDRVVYSRRIVVE